MTAEAVTSHSNTHTQALESLAQGSVKLLFLACWRVFIYLFSLLLLLLFFKNFFPLCQICEVHFLEPEDGRVRVKSLLPFACFQ